MSQYHCNETVHRMRKSGRRRFLASFRAAFSRCHWCEITIAWTDHLTEPYRVTANNREVEVFHQTGAVTYEIGTVDHAFPIEEGGTNELRNLVGSCRGCNLFRARKPKNPMRKVCRDCGGPKQTAPSRCPPCSRLMRAEFFLTLSPEEAIFRRIAPEKLEWAREYLDRGGDARAGRVA